MEKFKKMKSEKELLKERFYREMQYYCPNWKRIVHTNQSGRDGDYGKKLQDFCEAMKSIRETRGLSMQKMGERISYSRQFICEIEKKGIKKLPIHKLGLIANTFSVSVAYLIGLVEDDYCEPNITQYYFWEYPNSQYEIIKEEVIEGSLIHPMQTWGSPIDTILGEISQMLKNDYELALSIQEILKREGRKRGEIVSIIKSLAKI